MEAETQSVTIALTVTIATFMEVLDTSIANVALPHISGSLGAGQSEASWVISSYLVANAVVLPISGYRRLLWAESASIWRALQSSV